MSRLIRLFPKEWRDRYADEFEALLEETPLTVSTLVDVVFVASAARVRLAAGAAGSGLYRAIGRRLEGDGFIRAGAVAAIVAGSIWAATFAIGTIVDWGRNGQDWGFLLLMAAAIGVLLAMPTMASTIPTAGGRALGWLGTAVAVIGVGILLAALLAAIALEPPLSIRMGWSPLEIWEAGMLVVVSGVALLGVSLLPMRGAAAVVGASLTASAAALAVALVTGGPNHLVTQGTSSGAIAAASMSVAQKGWLVTDLRVSLPGVVFGTAWIILGALRIRHPSRSATAVDAGHPVGGAYR